MVQERDPTRRPQVKSPKFGYTASGGAPATDLLWIYPTLPTPYRLRGHVRHIHRRLVSILRGRRSAATAGAGHPPTAGPQTAPGGLRRAAGRSTTTTCRESAGEP